MEYKVFVVEDDDSIRGLYEIAFQDKFECKSFVNAEDMFEALKKESCDIIILDLMLPGMDGLKALSLLKENVDTKNIPVIIASAKGDENIKVRGLDAGADDYIAKPFSFSELQARIRALLRRKEETSIKQVITCADLTLDMIGRRATRGDKVIDLTVKEYRLLEYFMNNQGVALSRTQLLREVWDKNFDTNTNIVDVYVNYLRSKVDREFKKKLIHTVVGLGYMMEA